MELHTHTLQKTSRRIPLPIAPGGGHTGTQPIAAQTVHDNDKRLEQLGLDAEQRALLAQHNQTQSALQALFGGDPPQVTVGRDQHGQPSVKIHGEPPGPIVEALAKIGQVLAEQGMHAAALPYLVGLACALQDPPAQCLLMDRCSKLLSQDRAPFPLARFMALRERAFQLVQHEHLGIEYVDLFDAIGEQRYGTGLRAQSAQELLRQWKQQTGDKKTATLAQLMGLVKELDERLCEASPQDLQIHLELLKTLWEELGYRCGGPARDLLITAIQAAVKATSPWFDASGRLPPPNEPELLRLYVHLCNGPNARALVNLYAAQRDVFCTRATALFAKGQLQMETLKQLQRTVNGLPLTKPGWVFLLAIIQHQIDHLTEHPFFKREELIWKLCKKLVVLSGQLARLGADEGMEIATGLMQRLIDGSEVAITRDALKWELNAMIRKNPGAADPPEDLHADVCASRELMEWYVGTQSPEATIKQYKERPDASDPTLSQERYQQLRHYVFACARAGLSLRILQELVRFSVEAFPTQHEPDLLVQALLAPATDARPEVAHAAFDRYFQLASTQNEIELTVFSPGSLRQLAVTCAQMPTLMGPGLHKAGKNRLQQVIDWAGEHGHLKPEDAKRCWLWFYLEEAHAMVVSTVVVDKLKRVETIMRKQQRREPLATVLGSLSVQTDPRPLLLLDKKGLLDVANDEERLEFLQHALRCDPHTAGALLKSYWNATRSSADQSIDEQRWHGPIGSFVYAVKEVLLPFAPAHHTNIDLRSLPHQPAFDVDQLPEWDLLNRALLAFHFKRGYGAEDHPALPSFIVNLALRQSSWERRLQSGQAFMTALLHAVSHMGEAKASKALNILIQRLLGGSAHDRAQPAIDPDRGAMAAAMLLAVLEQHDQPLAESLITRHLRLHPLAGVYLGMVRTGLALSERRHDEAKRHWDETELLLGKAQQKPGVKLPDELHAPVESLRSQVQALSENGRPHGGSLPGLAAGPGG